MLTGWRDFDDTLRAFDFLQRRIDRAFDNRAARPGDRSRRTVPAPWPAINVFETKQAFVVKAEVPGLAESEVAVSVENNVLVVRGERKSDIPEGYGVHLRERAPVAFTRKLELPSRVSADGVAATLKDGILAITLPKTTESLPRQIAVKAG
jgi:HSP20 family protein